MAKAAKKNKGGAPTKYHASYAKQASVACEEAGFTDARLARLFGVKQSTISNWKNAHPKFLEAVRTGRETYDTQCVEASLLKRALGYRNVEAYREPDPANPDKLKIVKTVTKNVIPDVGAQKFWLRNRNRERWPDTQNIDTNVNISHEEMLDELE